MGENRLPRLEIFDRAEASIRQGDLRAGIENWIAEISQFAWINLVLNADQAIVCIGLHGFESRQIDLFNLAQFNFDKDQSVDNLPGLGH